MRVHQPHKAMRLPAGVLHLVLGCLVAGTVAACGSSPPSPTPRPELAWSRAAFELPPDVVDLAPGSSGGGMICSPCHAEQASLLTAVATTADGLLAVGLQLPPSTAVAYRSADGRSWEAEPGFTGDEDTAALGVAADNGRRVVVGRRGTGAAAWVAPAGAGRWQAAPDAASLRAPGGGGHAEMRAVAAWHDGFVAVGSRDEEAAPRAAIWASDDGLAWRLVSTGPAFDGGGAFGIAASDDRLVVVGGTGDDGTGPAVAWVSGDGDTWRRVESPVFAAGPMRAVTRTESGFTAVGYGVDDDRAAAWTSPDGESWEAHPEAASLQNHGKPVRMLAVAADRATVVAAGWKSDAGNGSGVLWRSTGAGTWDRLPDQVSMSGASLAGVAFTGGEPVVVGTSGYPDNDQASAWYEEP